MLSVLRVAFFIRNPSEHFKCKKPRKESVGTVFYLEINNGLFGLAAIIL